MYYNYANGPKDLDIKHWRAITHMVLDNHANVLKA
jgi:hypothetical protein